MTLMKRLEAVKASAELAEAVRLTSKTPDGWQAGFELAPDGTGVLTTGPMPAGVALDDGVWKHLMEDWGLDPTVTEVVPGSVILKGWDSNVAGGATERRLSYRAVIQPSVARSEAKDYEDLYREVLKVKRSEKVWGGDRTLLVCLSDFQVGNGDYDGLEGQIRALAALVASVPARLKALRKMGHQIDCVCIAGMGDLMEGCSQNYPAQQFRTEADHREQVKIVRRAIRDILMSIAPLVDEVKVLCVPGNHGERRVNGHAFTRVGDNDDVAVFEQVADILSHGSAYEHFRWRIPSDEIAVAVALSGVQTAFTHGHVARMSGDAIATGWKWWEKQSHGRAYPGVADATILITGHFHHFCAKEQAGRSLFICPSLTNVSEYFADTNGVNTKPGTLSMLIGGPGEWSEIALI